MCLWSISLTRQRLRTTHFARHGVVVLPRSMPRNAKGEAEAASQALAKEGICVYTLFKRMTDPNFQTVMVVPRKSARETASSALRGTRRCQREGISAEIPTKIQGGGGEGEALHRPLKPLQAKYDQKQPLRGESKQGLQEGRRREKGYTKEPRVLSSGSEAAFLR